MTEFDAPTASAEDARTVICATVTASAGRLPDNVTLILDDNWVPICEVIAFDRPRRRFAFHATMRVNGPTPLHAVARRTTECFVKTSGQGDSAALRTGPTAKATGG